MRIKKGVSTGTEPTGSMSYSGTACGSTLVPNSSFSAHFYQPGDQIEYTLTITNKSTVTAAIKSILVDNESVTSNTTKKKGNIIYIIEMPETTTLAPNASTTMKVIAKFQNETDVTGNVNGETQSIEVKINAEQYDGSNAMTVERLTTVYAYHTDTKTIGTSTITDGKADYNDVISEHYAWKYLKYEIDENNIIRKAWVCNSSMFSPDTICFQGYKDVNTNQTYFNDNVLVATAFNNNTSSGARCYIGSDISCNEDRIWIWINAYSDGSVRCNGMGGTDGCFITAEGSTYCT